MYIEIYIMNSAIIYINPKKKFYFIVQIRIILLLIVFFFPLQNEIKTSFYPKGYQGI